VVPISKIQSESNSQLIDLLQLLFFCCGFYFKDTILKVFDNFLRTLRGFLNPDKIRDKPIGRECAGCIFLSLE
jgi:hypothetical protein